jgi:putative GTP pyrophosphokinase
MAKRSIRIGSKLQRQKTLRLSQMQDIGGLRAVVDDIEQVNRLRDAYVDLTHSNFEHKCVDQRDYIAAPRESGYRGIHLVYRYQNRRAPKYEGLQVEIQIRTKTQHFWATAVETVGTFLSEALKSSEGPGDWLDFFALAGSAFAHIESCPPVAAHQAISKRNLFNAVLKEADALKVREQLAGYTVAVDRVTSDQFRQTNRGEPHEFHLIVLNMDTRRLTVTPFSRTRLPDAIEEYTKIEKEISGGQPSQAVLVSAGSISALKRAYPNYFGDTREFVKVLDSMIVP